MDCIDQLTQSLMIKLSAVRLKMGLKKSQLCRNLAKILKKELKKYREIEDIIIFGSVMREKDSPEDIDILIVLKKYELTLTAKIKSVINKTLDNKLPIHIESIMIEDYIKQPILITTLLEGFSIKETKRMADILDLKPLTLFTYKGKTLSPADKMAFSRALRYALKETKAEKKGRGNVIVPRNKADLFEDMLKLWKDKISYSKINMIKTGIYRQGH